MIKINMPYKIPKYRLGGQTRVDKLLDHAACQLANINNNVTKILTYHVLLRRCVQISEHGDTALFCDVKSENRSNISIVNGLSITIAIITYTEM